MSEEQGGDGSFEQRLRAAESRRVKAPADPADRGAQTGAAAGPTALGIGLRVGVELVSALVVAVAIGWALDRWLHTMPLFLVLFILLGGAAGILNVWRVMAPRR
jgi:ATP synthase protein I